MGDSHGRGSLRQSNSQMDTLKATDAHLLEQMRQQTVNSRSQYIELIATGKIKDDKKKVAI